MDDPTPTERDHYFWEKTYRQNIDRLIGVGYRYTANQQIAEDLAQDTFMIAYQKAESFKGSGPFEAWLRRIMVNVCLQYLRELHKKKYLADWLKNETSTVEPDEEYIDSPDFPETVLLAAINQLAEHHKLVFNLYILDNFTHAQIGQELGISEGTSKSHLARARKKIKALLHESGNSAKKEKKNTALLLFSWNVDSVYQKRFKNFVLPSHKAFSFDSLHNQPVHAAVSVPIIPVLKKKSVLTIASVITAVFAVSIAVYLIAERNNSASKKETFVIKNDNLSNDSKVVIDTPSQPGINSNVNKQKNTVPVSPDETGSFYGELLYWSGEDHELYFRGKTRVRFGKKNYASDSSVNFLGKVYLLVLDGKVSSLEPDVKKDIKLVGKKYKLTKLSPERASRKYGEEGKNGAIEISSAELYP